ncbi:MAG: glycosyltransferase family 2 protein [Bacteriovoracia bacterium]
MGKDMSKGQQPVSVVIPTWNAAAFVDRVLEALTKQQGVEYEILVVDNGVVNADTEAVANRHREYFPNLRYLKFERQLGYAGAVNAGAAAAQYPLVAVMNNDNIPEARWLVELLSVFEAEATERSSVIVGSLIERPGFSDPLGCNLNFWARIVRVPGWRRNRNLFHPDGSAFLFDKRVFPVPYDEDYFVYQEDVALGWRAWLEGHRVLLAEKSRGVSFDGGSTRRIAYKTAYFTERNRWINYLCYLSIPNLLCALPALFLDNLFKLAFGKQRGAKLHAWAWLVVDPGHIWNCRQAIQKNRKRHDRDILPLLSGSYRGSDESGRVILNGLFRFLCSACGLKLGR